MSRFPEGTTMPAGTEVRGRRQVGITLPAEAAYQLQMLAFCNETTAGGFVETLIAEYLARDENQGLRQWLTANYARYRQ
jgi:hypothetical protein